MATELEIVKGVEGRNFYRTPIDPETGIPFSFKPNPDLKILKKLRDEGIYGLHDLNHQFPKHDVITSPNPELSPLGRRALIGARGQYVSYIEHHDIYNPQFVGPELPPTRNNLFRTVVFLAAGVVPEGALDFSRKEPRIALLKPDDRTDLWVSGQLRIINKVDVCQFLLDYVMNSELDHIRPGEVEEFLYTQNMDRRRYLGHALTAKLVERAVEPIEDDYRSIRRKGKIVPLPINPSKTIINNPRNLVTHHLTPGSRFARVHDALQQRLTEHQSVALAA